MDSNSGDANDSNAQNLESGRSYTGRSSDEQTHPKHSTGRRQFLKSLFGLGTVIETQAAPASAAVAGTFVWADLKTGQVGFPTGTNIKPGLPGSLMKLVAAAAIRQENLLPANATFECKGTVVVHKHRYSCQVAHGRLGLVEAVGQSCNVFFAQAAQSLSAGLFLSYARKFALNSPVAGYPSGPFPADAGADSLPYVLGLSDDLQPNALQILQLSALIASRGRPPVLHSAEDPNPQWPAVTLELAKATWDVLAEGMQYSGRLGTASSLDPDNKLNLAVKTGTAPHGKTFQSWITGYFPWDYPRHAFCARAQAGTSRSAAIPLARQFLFSTEWP